jgi:hypothetical protein
MQFQLQLANESWESVCVDNDTNSKFNSLLHTFVNIFEASFPVKYKNINRNENVWIAQGIKISCECKRRIYTYTHTSGILMMQ